MDKVMPTRQELIDILNARKDSVSLMAATMLQRDSIQLNDLRLMVQGRGRMISDLRERVKRLEEQDV
jgi:hypothetical protein